MSTITDDDLSHLLDELAASYDVPEHGPEDVLAAVADVPSPLPLARRRWVQLSAAAAIITAGAVYAGVTHFGGSTGTAGLSRASKADGRLEQAPAAAPAAGTAVSGLAGASSASGASGGVAQFAPSGAGSGAVAAPAPARTGLAPTDATTAATARAPSAAGPTGAVGAPVQDDAAGRVVKSGTIALVVKSKRVTPTITAVIAAGKSYGGYVASSHADEYGDTPSGEVTLRVPVGHFEDLVNKVRGLDAKVRTSNTSGKDVTAAYSDLGSQLKSLNASRDRFYLILGKTTTIGEILTVQQRIDDVSAQIDLIQGQRKLLADQSDLSTLTVSVSEAGDPVVTATTKPRSGIAEAFVNAKDGFVTGVEAIISHSGRVVLWLLCLVALALLVRSVFRVARRRMV